MEKEFSLKDLIERIIHFSGLLWKFKYYIIVFSLLLGAYYTYKSSQVPDRYVSKLTFMVNEESGSGFSGAAAILGQFGLGGGSPDKNLDKVVELALSRKIISEVLFSSYYENNEKKFIYNSVLNEYFSDYNLTSEFFHDGSSLDSLSLDRNKMLLECYYRIIGTEKQKPLLKVDYSDNTGILFIEMKTSNEYLSFSFTKILFEILSQFYILQSTEKQSVTVNQLKIRVDSVANELKKTEYELARIQDNSKNIILNQNKISVSKAQQKMQILTLQYGELLKNFATAEFLLSTSTP